jgi:hypothetical protein
VHGAPLIGKDGVVVEAGLDFHTSVGWFWFYFLV